MTASDPPPLTVVPPGAGPTGILGSIGVAFKLWGADTGGALSIVEHPFPVGALVGAHLHTREDEYSIVTEGEIGFRSGDREVVLGSGGYITKPRGEMHAMWNAGAVPARMIEIISPAGFEHFFRELAEMVSSGAAGLDQVTATGRPLRTALRQPRLDSRRHHPLPAHSPTRRWHQMDTGYHRRIARARFERVPSSSSCVTPDQAKHAHADWISGSGRHRQGGRLDARSRVGPPRWPRRESAALAAGRETGAPGRPGCRSGR